jgi:hypothetical protein
MLAFLMQTVARDSSPESLELRLHAVGIGLVRHQQDRWSAETFSRSPILSLAGGKKRSSTAGEQKAKYATLRAFMAARTCRVTITDLDGVSHTVEVTATTLYEAVALGLVALRDSEWIAGIPEGLAAVRVSVTSIPIEHSVEMQDFKNWVE